MHKMDGTGYTSLYFSIFIFFKYLYLFMYLAVPVLSSGMWDLVPRPVIQPGPRTLRAQNFSH